MGFRTEGWKVPFYEPDVRFRDVYNVAKTVFQKKLSQGSVVGEYERELAECIGTKEAIVVNSGTAALHLALASLGIGKEDEVIVPSFTFVATVNAVLYVGAKPVFVDINSDTYCMDVKDVENKITSKTKAIIPVHLCGQSVDIDGLYEIVTGGDMYLIEDAAQAIGCRYKGHKVGTLGDVGCFSTYVTKTLGNTGEGGFITTDDDKLANKMRAMRSHGQVERYKHKYFGWNYRMSDINASLGLSQLSRLGDMIESKRKIAFLYGMKLHGLEKEGHIILPKTSSYSTHTYTFFMILCRDKIVANRIMLKAEDEKVQVIRAYLPVHKQPYLKGCYDNVKLLITDSYSDRLLFLPCFPCMKEKLINEVVEVVGKGCE